MSKAISQFEPFKSQIDSFLPSWSSTSVSVLLKIHFKSIQFVKHNQNFLVLLRGVDTWVWPGGE